MTTTSPELILRLGSIEVRTHDPLAISTCWRLLGSAISPEEHHALIEPFGNGEPL